MLLSSTLPKPFPAQPCGPPRLPCHSSMGIGHPQGVVVPLSSLHGSCKKVLMILHDFGSKHPTTVTRTLLGAPGIATRSKDATSGSWPYY